MELAKLKDTAIRELIKRNGDLFETQKVILNSMTQGIALTCKNRGEDQTFFLNSSIKKMLAGVIESSPQLKKTLDKMKVKQNQMNPEKLDFLKSQEIMDFKMFIKKRDQYE